jgi:hypothetical protein
MKFLKLRSIIQFGNASKDKILVQKLDEKDRISLSDIPFGDDLILHIPSTSIITNYKD